MGRPKWGIWHAERLRTGQHSMALWSLTARAYELAMLGNEVLQKRLEEGSMQSR